MVLQENSSLKINSKQDFNNEFKSFINLLKNIPKVFIHGITMLTIYFLLKIRINILVVDG